jgi:hypothetical protein
MGRREGSRRCRRNGRQTRFKLVLAQAPAQRDGWEGQPCRSTSDIHNAPLPPRHRHENLHDEDAEGHSEWRAKVKGGAPARHALLPLVWDCSGPVAL